MRQKLMDYMSNGLKIVTCSLLHQKEIKHMRADDSIYIIQIIKCIGCKKCNVWRRINDND